jgi:hypothetical protein
MIRLRTAALSLAAAGAAALTLGVVAGPAVAHGFGHHDFRGGHHRHALAGAVQSVDTSANTAVITLGGDRGLHRDWNHGRSTSSDTRQVTLDLSGATIYDASAMKRDCHTGSSSSATPATLSDVQQGDVVTAVLAVSRSTARHDIESGTAVPVAKLIDWGAPSTASHDEKSDARRLVRH